jgi:hypothetical protein
MQMKTPTKMTLSNINGLGRRRFEMNRMGIIYFVFSLLFYSTAVSAQTEQMSLGAPEGFVASGIERITDSEYCISGELVNDIESTNTAWVALIDFSKRNVVFKTALPFTKPYAANFALHCAHGENAFYVLTGEQTHTEESLAQTRVKLSKLSADGKLLASQWVNSGADEWAYFLLPDKTGVSVAGGTSTGLQRKGKLSTFFATFDTMLERTSSISMSSGAFWTGAKAIISGHALRIAGRFLPNSDSSSEGHRAFAISQIDLDTRRYVFSTYVSPNDVLSEMADFDIDGTAYYAATTRSGMYLSIVAKDGRVARTFSLKTNVCELKAIHARDKAIDVIGSTCDRKGGSSLVTVDSATQRIVSEQPIPGAANVAYLDGDAWITATDEGQRGIILRRGHLTKRD